MTVSVRAYRDPDDYDLVYGFLGEIYESGDQLLSWLPPRWEFSRFHPLFEDVDPTIAGIAETEDGTVIGIVVPEWSAALGNPQIRPGHEYVKPSLVNWGEEHMGGWSTSLQRNVLGFYVNDADTELQTLMSERGYERSPEWTEFYARMVLDELLPEVPLPLGFRLQGLAEENDLRKINSVLWRGFDHPGPPPDEELPGRALMQRPATFRKDHNIVAVAPDGSFVAYAGIWFLPEHRVAYVEPVATDPDYRSMGLGKAVVFEAIRRTQKLGATVAWVGSNQPFYLAMEFEVVDSASPWIRDLERIEA